MWRWSGGRGYALDAGTQQIVRVYAASGEPDVGSRRLCRSRPTFYRPRGMGVDAGGLVGGGHGGGRRVVMLILPGGWRCRWAGRDAVGAGAAGGRDCAGWDSSRAITAEDGRLWRLDLMAGLTAVPWTNTIDGRIWPTCPTGLLSAPTRRGHGSLFCRGYGELPRQFANT